MYKSVKLAYGMEIDGFRWEKDEGYRLDVEHEAQQILIKCFEDNGYKVGPTTILWTQSYGTRMKNGSFREHIFLDLGRIPFFTSPYIPNDASAGYAQYVHMEHQSSMLAYLANRARVGFAPEEEPDSDYAEAHVFRLVATLPRPPKTPDMTGLVPEDVALDNPPTNL